MKNSFEQTVAEGDEEQGEAGKSKQPGGIAGIGGDGHGQHHIANGHDHEACHDGPLIVLLLVGDVSANQAQ